MASRPVHVVVPLDDPLEVAMARFRAAPEAWLPMAGAPGPSGGHALDLATGGLLPGPLVTVHAHVGAVLEPTAGVAMRPLSWYPVQFASALPALDADLELDLRSDAGRRPCLRLVGSYVTPLAVVDESDERLASRRLVAEVARGFLTAVARRLQAVDAHGASATATTAAASTSAVGVPTPTGPTDPTAGPVAHARRRPHGHDGTTSGGAEATADPAARPRAATRPAQRRIAMTDQGAIPGDPTATAADGGGSPEPSVREASERDRLGMVVLTEDECWDRLEAEPVGRLALVVEDRPYLVPINHVVRGRELYMVSVEGTKLHELLLRPNQPAAFEVDGYDPGARTGWSVVVHGHMHAIEDLVEHTYQDVRGRPVWLDGYPDRAWLRLDPESIEGRVLDHGRTGDEHSAQ